ncbi:hypothetical protein [Arthrobacter sp. MYb213]|uniref:hypothetical protein n=1 Tax=Arthrobacter sp. MYb213 TaxID=1848595 RepID=UPI000CFB77DD|nr:hypothetical protein [Arthrobacter sp. MYb213]PRB66774.1 hypothetical protein CQ011_17140 [Arthrobacter sp. MYb213]
MSPEQPRSIGDFPSKVGQTYTGEWMGLDPQRIAGFWVGTYLDETYGQSLGPEYPPGLVEGFYQLALLDYLSAQIIGRWHGFNYGLDKVRFIRPLNESQQVRLALTVAETASRDSGLLVTYDAVLEASGQEKPAMAARWLVLLQDLQPHNYTQ